MEKICIFCGSSPGSDTLYTDVAKRFGEILSERKIGLVYGGGNVGLMGELADSVLQAGGEVIGVIPRFLIEKEVGHTGLTELHVVDSMHERKLLMSKLAGGFVALPGGLGTLDEIFEILTWAQLGLHAKPCGFLNVGNYFDELFSFLDYMVEQRFVTRDNRQMILTEEEPEVILEKMAAHQAVISDKWLDRA